MNYIDTLNEIGVRPTKGRGQNFLKDPQLSRALVSFAEVKPGMPVLEIGPGLGAITSSLIEAKTNLIVVDIEPAFCQFILKQFPEIKKDKTICADIRLLNLSDLAKILGEASIAVVSNLPYSISSDVINWLVKNRSSLKFASLLLQEDYIDRLIAKPNTKAYGSLSVFTQLYFETSVGRRVSGKCFFPEASVPSKVIRLVPRIAPPCEISDLDLFEKVVRACFHQRRKTLLNSISHSGLIESKETVSNILRSAEINPIQRAESLSMADFARIAKVFSS